jgi:hypothetical protein
MPVGTPAEPSAGVRDGMGAFAFCTTKTPPNRAVISVSVTTLIAAGARSYCRNLGEPGTAVGEADERKRITRDIERHFDEAYSEGIMDTGRHLVRGGQKPRFPPRTLSNAG